MIYFAQTSTGSIKIGTTINLRNRLSALKSYFGNEVLLLATMPGDRAEERRLHEKFAHLRFPGTEQFRPAPDLIEFIGRPLLVCANPDAIIVERPKPTGRVAVSFRFKPVTVRQIAEIAKRMHGLSDVRVISLAIEQLHAHVCRTNQRSTRRTTRRKDAT
jgi:hypothetical protein